MNRSATPPPKHRTARREGVESLKPGRSITLLKVKENTHHTPNGSTQPRRNPPDHTPCLSRRVSFFRNAKAPDPVEDVTLAVALERIREERYRAAVERVLSAPPERQQDVKAVALPAFTPSGLFRRRAAASLREHSGLFVLDVDDKTDPDGHKAKLAADPHVVAAFRSPRGGVKAIVAGVGVDTSTGEHRLPANDAEHKAGMAAVFAHFGHVDPDPSGADVSRLCYFSVDPAPYVNPDAVPLEFELSPEETEGHAPHAEAGRLSFEEMIPHGQQYHTLASLLGAVRRLGFGEAFLLSLARHVYDGHLENPNDWPKVEKLARDLAAKPVDPDTSAEAMVRRALKAMGHPDAADVSTETPEAETLPWLPFPVEALPGPLAAYVQAHAAALDADPAFVAVPTLAALSAAVGNSHRIRLKRSWVEPGALWAVVVADSGSRKSPALQAALEPVFGLEREAKETHEQERELYEAEKREYDALTKKQRGEKPPPELATRRRYRVGDTTVESLVFVHEQNPRGLLLARDELAGWLGSFDRYARGESDMQVWIEMHGGRPVTIDRKSADQPVLFLESPNVSAAGTIQPDVLRRQLTPLHISSGFAARLLLAEPPTRPKRWTDADVTPDVSAAYHRLIRGLYALPFSPDAGPSVLGLTPEAQAAFVAFVNENGAKQHALSSGPLHSALSKHEALAARLALHLHLADAVASGAGSGAAIGPVSAYSMGQAVRLARWFRYETARLYQRYGIEEQTLDRDERLAAELPEAFGWRDVAELWGVKKAGAYKVIERLQEKGLAEDAGHGSFRRCVEGESPGRRVDFGDFAGSEGAKVSKVYQSTHPLPADTPAADSLPPPSGDGAAGPFEPPPADPAEPWAPWTDEDETGLAL